MRGTITHATVYQALNRNIKDFFRTYCQFTLLNYELILRSPTRRILNLLSVN